MNNVKGYAIANDGNMKRIAITYDAVGDDGKPVKVNAKTSNFVLDESVLSAISVLDNYALSVVDSLE